MNFEGDSSDKALDDNFFYGRNIPALGNGSQLGGVKAILLGRVNIAFQSNPMKAIGYYYEDEDDYDQKTMYINDESAVDVDRASRAESRRTPSQMGAGVDMMSDPNKDDMYERLRRINQHMYR